MIGTVADGCQHFDSELEIRNLISIEEHPRTWNFFIGQFCFYRPSHKLTDGVVQANHC